MNDLMKEYLRKLNEEQKVDIDCQVKYKNLYNQLGQQIIERAELIKKIESQPTKNEII